MGDVYTFVEPDGVETVLPVFDPKVGRGMPPIELVEQAVPGQAGARLRDVRHGVRILDLTTAVRGPGDAQVRADLRAWLRRVDPVRGEGIIRCDTVAGDSREIGVRYAGGLELEETDPTWHVQVVTFHALEPYWRDAADTAATFTRGENLEFFPILPLELAPGSVWAAPSIDNVGDVDSWPTWTITGPATSLALVNATTGERLDLSTTLAVGDTVTIDTRPGVKTIRDGDGVNLYPDLGVGSSLWPLTRGSNTVEITLEGASDASSVGLAYRARYLGA